jgi:hypothetical protein
VIITEVRPQDPSQVVLVLHNHMIEVLPPDGSDQPFHECLLSWTGWSSPNFFGPLLPGSQVETLRGDML